ncbi:MAG: hypothetical protein ACTSYB_04410 [Candidatus Helarchaeota archaeon]
MLYQIKDLTPDSKRINIIVKLVSKSAPRYAKGYKIVTFMASDPTGQIPIPFWNNESQAVKVGDVIEIQNGYVSTFRGQMQLNIGKFGSFQHVDPPENFEINADPLPLIKEGSDVEITPIEALEHQTKNLTLCVYIKEKVEQREVRTKKDGNVHQVATFLVGDASGCILLNLWDDWINAVKVGAVFTIYGAYVRIFRNQRFLNLSRNGRIEPCETDIRFNKVNNLSERIIIN